MMLPMVKQLNTKRIVLASSSPRRKELLKTVVSIFISIFSVVSYFNALCIQKKKYFTDFYKSFRV